MDFDKTFDKFNDTISAIITDEYQLEECSTAVDNLKSELEDNKDEFKKLQMKADRLEDELEELKNENEELLLKSVNSIYIKTSLDKISIYLEKENLLITQIFEALAVRLEKEDYNKLLEDLK